MTATCLCGCPTDLHIGDIGCPCGLPWAPVCAGWLHASPDYITPSDAPIYSDLCRKYGVAAAVREAT